MESITTDEIKNKINNDKSPVVCSSRNNGWQFTVRDDIDLENYWSHRNKFIGKFR